MKILALSIAGIAAIAAFGGRGVAELAGTIPEATLEKRHEPSGAHTGQTTLQTAESALDFEKYIENVRAMAGSVVQSTGLTDEQRRLLSRKADSFPENAVNAAAPFQKPAATECGGSKGGALLVHGLTDTPFLMRDVADVLTKSPSCLHVRSLLLPGHGTRPADLLDVEWEQWRDAVAYGINGFQGVTDKLYLVGFSTGGALALYHAFHQDRVPALHQEKVALKGLILLSPAVEVFSPSARYASLHRTYSWAWPIGKWDDVAKDVDYSKYESFPKNAGFQIYRLTQELAELPGRKQLTVPALLAASASDTTIQTCGTVEFFSRRIRTNGSSFILYQEKPGDGVPQKKSRERDCSDIIKKEKDAGRIIARAIRQERILDMAHISVPVAPGNQHYGAKGSDYANCVHYDDGHPERRADPKKYEACRASIGSASTAVWSGEMTDQNFKREEGVGRRLSYNPDFEELAASIQSFVKETRDK